MPEALGTISVQYRQYLANDTGAATIAIKLKVPFSYWWL